ncbi:hypothetical protein BJ742DRAFT_478086 [Cladochytrium replicatum]|nr:hypothetical protein BJ742DRAFT_478086 [Cladochytrium replicatum]
MNKMQNSRKNRILIRLYHKSFLKTKYVMFVKDYVVPRITDMDKDNIASLYSDLRRESLIGESIPITVRHIEAFARIQRKG